MSRSAWAARRSAPSRPASAGPRLLDGDELRFEAVLVLEIGGVMVWPAGVRVPVSEQRAPAVLDRLAGQLVHSRPAGHVEREMVQPGTAPVVGGRSKRRRLLDHDVGRSGLPAPPGRPVLVLLVVHLSEQPPPRVDGAGQVGHPQLHVMQRHLLTYSPIRRPAGPANAGRSTCRPPRPPRHRPPRPAGPRTAPGRRSGRGPGSWWYARSATKKAIPSHTPATSVARSGRSEQHVRERVAVLLPVEPGKQLGSYLIRPRQQHRRTRVHYRHRPGSRGGNRPGRPGSASVVRRRADLIITSYSNSTATDSPPARRWWMCRRWPGCRQCGSGGCTDGRITCGLASWYAVRAEALRGSPRSVRSAVLYPAPAGDPPAPDLRPAPPHRRITRCGTSGRSQPSSPSQVQRGRTAAALSSMIIEFLSVFELRSTARHARLNLVSS